MSWLEHFQSVVLNDAREVFTPADPGSQKRTHACTEDGLFRLSRRDAALYCIEIHSGGGWGRVALLDGSGRLVFYQPSTFTGSFPLNEGCAADGLYLLSEGCGASDAQVSVSWREKDSALV